MTEVVDKAHLKKAIWEAIETHLRRLDALYKELIKKFEAKDADAVEKTGKYILECGIDLISDANSLIVLDTLGEKVS